METLLDKKKENRKILFFLTIIILIQCVFITVIFATQKKGYHSDELWNYGFANSSDGKHIYSENDGTLKNIGKWTDSKKFLEYISVDKNEIFDYKSIYNNAAGDLNPPLQYMLLHFVCSFFPNVWSKWFCFIINIIAFAITQIFIYKTLSLINCDEIIAVLGVLLYGFCVGAADIAVFLRIYALGVAFSAMFFYLFTKIYIKAKDNNVKLSDIIKLFLVCFLGVFTIHQFLIVAFVITLMYSIGFLAQKKYKYMFAFGIACLAAVVVSFLVFPSTVSHLTEPGQPYAPPQGTEKIISLYQFVEYLSFVSKDIIGIHPELEISAFHAIFSMVVGIPLVVLLIICMIFKDKEWVIKIKNKAVDFWRNFKRSIMDKGYPLLVAFACVVFDLGVCAVNSSIINMGVYSKRYIFLIYPIFLIVVICIAFAVLRSFNLGKEKLYKAGTLLLVVFAALSFILSDVVFLFRFEQNGISFDDIEKDADCIIVVEDIWILTAATGELYDTNSFYAIGRKEYEQDNYMRENKDKPLYLVIDVSAEALYDNEDDAALAAAFGMMTNKQEILDYYEALPISSKCELVGEDYLFDRKMEIYRLD